MGRAAIVREALGPSAVLAPQDNLLEGQGLFYPVLDLAGD